MCGRYVSAVERSRIERQFDALARDGDDPLPADYNVAPTKHVYAVVNRHDQRQLRTMTWGLIPSWAKDASIGNKLINARLETAAEKPSFKRAWTKRRAVVPANGYYEWYTRQPFFITPTDGSVMAMAGLYEIWRNREVDDENDPGAFRWTCTILTTSAIDKFGQIHDRMPLLVSQQNLATWLDPELAEPPAKLLVPASPDILQAFPVSTAVNNVRNNGPELIDPLAAPTESAEALF